MWLARYYAQRLGTAARGTLHAVDPTTSRLRGLAPAGALDRTTLLCVYRARNHALVERLVAEATGLSMPVALWALDRPIPRLEALTLGAGPGSRVVLLNRLAAAALARGGDRLVLSDDDVRFTRGGFASLLAIVATCRLGIAQPAHGPGSHVSHPITRARLLTLARLTTFVENGPMVVVTGPWLSRVFPFPEDLGMGWGLELLWHDLWKEGCPLGIVDGVMLEHVRPPAGAYSFADEDRRYQVMLDARDRPSKAELRRSLRAWRVWEARPPW